MDNGVAVMVRDLRKSYRDVTAVDGMDLDIARGEVFALLGPNGAGKTTTVEILEGFRRRDRRHGDGARPGSGRRPAGLAGQDRHRAAAGQRRGRTDRARDGQALRRLLPAARATRTR